MSQLRENVSGDIALAEQGSGTEQLLDLSSNNRLVLTL
jgi:hypothetical protein